MKVTKAYLEENHADLVAEIRAEGAAGVSLPTIDAAYLEENHADLVQSFEARGAEAAATAERERIVGIHELVIAGHEDLAAEAVNDPKVTPEVFAIRQVKAEQKVGSGALAGLKKAEKEQDAPDAAAAEDDYAPEAVEEGQATRLKSASPRLRKQAAQK